MIWVLAEFLMLVLNAFPAIFAIRDGSHGSALSPFLGDWPNPMGAVPNVPLYKNFLACSSSFMASVSTNRDWNLNSRFCFCFCS